MISSILYFVTAVCFFGIAFIFFKTKNGIVRKIFIGLPLAISFAALIRAIDYMFPGLFSEDCVVVLVAIPQLLAGFSSFMFLYFKYYKHQI